MIDNGSALLSQMGRDGTITIKSNYMENLSIKTPATTSTYTKTTFTTKSYTQSEQRSLSTRAKSLKKYNLNKTQDFWLKYRNGSLNREKKDIFANNRDGSLNSKPRTELPSIDYDS